MASHATMPRNAGGDPTGPPASVRLVLSGVMLLAGLVALTDVAFASVATTGFIGTAAKSTCVKVPAPNWGPRYRAAPSFLYWPPHAAG